MKPSHRKDVIIARIIFAAICIFIIAGITAIVVTLASGSRKKADNANDDPGSVSVSESEDEADTEIGSIYIPESTTENVGESLTYVTTTNSVNMREKPDKNAQIITVIAADVKLEYISEDNGWTQVIFQGQTGYVSSDYVKTSIESAPADNSADDNGTADNSVDNTDSTDGTTGTTGDAQ